MKKIGYQCLLGLVFLLISSCAKNPVTGKRDIMLMSTAQEIAMGQQSDPEITALFGVYEDKALQQFIEEKGQQMAAISHRKDLKYQFKVVDSPVINAFAVPGGYVYFTRGIMAHFNNEAEFAGVLGHEIGHITARHSAKQYSRAMLAQIGLIAGMVVAPDLAQFADAAQQGVALLFLKFGRDAERESDKLGVEYSSTIGYDAQEMADFFETLDRTSKQAGAEAVPDFLSTHPNPLDRQDRVTKLAADYKRKLNLTNPKVNRNNYLKMIDGLVYGEDPRQGFVENSVFYHPVLKFQFPVPAAWELQNTQQAVQMAEKNGRALMMLTLAQGESMEAVAEGLLQKYQLKPLDVKKETVNGLPALAVVADQQASQEQQQSGQQQPPIRVLMYLIQYGGNIYNMMGVSTTTDFATYFPQFTATASNFRQLTDSDKINRKPDRIRIKEVKQNSTLAQVLRQYNVSDAKKQEELAILNGMKLTDQVEKGTMIKVIER